MKGLLLKDWYVLVRYCRSFLLIMVAFLAVSLGAEENNLFFTMYPCLLCGILPVTLLSYDEKFRWNRYSAALPVDRGLIVGVKYLLGLLCIAAAALVTLAVTAVAGRGASSGELLSLGEMMIAGALMVPTVTLPLMFALGVEKGRIGMYVVLAGVLALAAFGGRTVTPREGAAMVTGPGLHGALALAAALYAASWRVSTFFYAGKEL